MDSGNECLLLISHMELCQVQIMQIQFFFKAFCFSLLLVIEIFCKKYVSLCSKKTSINRRNVFTDLAYNHLLPYKSILCKCTILGKRQQKRKRTAEK